MAGGINLLQDALILSKWFRVFPLRPGTNVPLIPKPKVDLNSSVAPEDQIAAQVESYIARYGGGTGRGFHDATRDEDQIRAWWTKTPDANIGIATGACWINEEEWQLTVVDIDEHDPAQSGNEAWSALLEELGVDEPETWCVLSPTSGGRHLYFLTKKAYSNGAAKGLPAGIDVRGDGGYVVGPPSPRGGGSYEWDGADLPGFPIAEAPAWLVAKFEAGDVTDEAMRAKMLDAAEAKRARDPNARPMDRWMAQVRWDDLLKQAGATEISIDMDAAGNVTSTWARPGVDHASASLNWLGGNVLKVFTSNWPGLAENRTYDKWAFAASQFYGGSMDAVKDWWTTEERRRGDDPASKAARLFDEGLAAGDIMGLEAPATRPDPPVPPTIAEPGEVVTVWSRPTVQIIRSDQRDAVARILEAWHEINSPDCGDPSHPGSPLVYSRGGEDVRLHVDADGKPTMERLTIEIFRAEIAEYCRFWEWMPSKTEKDDGGKPLQVQSFKFLPDTHARAVLASRGSLSRWELRGFSPIPVLRRDLTWAVERGYDGSTGYYVRDAFALAPSRPTPEQAKAAVELVAECFDQFPFSTAGDFANAFALYLTPIMRPYLSGDVPLAIVNAHSPGIGKSALARGLATLHTGVPGGLYSNLGLEPKNDEENAKQITAILLADPNAVPIWDNIDHQMRSMSITRLVTSRVWTGRRLGFSETVTLTNNLTPIVTGNNVEFGGDYARRSYRIHLELPPDEIEKPEKRIPAGGWKHPNLEAWIVESRTEILTAMMTMVNAWIAAGRPMWTATGKGAGFAEWSGVIGGILDVCEVTGFLSDDEAFQAEADSDQAEWAEFLSCLYAVVGSLPVTASTVLAMVLDAEKVERDGSVVVDLLHRAKIELGQALPGYVNELRPRGMGSMARSLGRAMSKRNGRREGNWVLKRLDLRTANKTHFVVTPLNAATNTAAPAETVPGADSAEASGASSPVAVGAFEVSGGEMMATAADVGMGGEMVPDDPHGDPDDDVDLSMF